MLGTALRGAGVGLLLLGDSHGCGRVAQRAVAPAPAAVDQGRRSGGRSGALVRERMRMSALELDRTLLEALRTLVEHDVEFIVIGDVAAAIHDRGGFVAGLAIVPGAYGRNVERLNTALQAMDAELGIAGTPAQTQFDYRRMDLREVAPCSFITRYVDVDVNFAPTGTGGYRDLFDDAAPVELARGMRPIRPLVAAPADLERIGRGSAPMVPYAMPPAALPPEPDADGLSATDVRAGRPTRI
jgi:hypothetical protein